MLVGLGLGPGDPELLTLRAVRLIKEADVVFVPGKIAYNLVLPYREAEILEFPMTEDEGIIRDCMERNSERIAGVAMEGMAVLGILGDPNFFSTFSRLCEVMEQRHPDIRFCTEPGVSSITAFASVAGISLSDGFLVTDGREPRYRIILKVRKPKLIAEKLMQEGYSSFILVERMFMGDTKIFSTDNLPETSDYMSIMYAGR
ncbi:MAG TPA: cobalt-factor II C(20)-methyltransferase [Methanoregulaceae archaeon]|nr:cobalt-factor II C(20)-methyltransferase [Methanoregulaceae archaeon]